MVSIQSSSYGVSALVSSQAPSATKNAENGPGKASGIGQTGKAEGPRPAGGRPAAEPVTGAAESAETADEPATALAFVETDDTEDFAQSEAPSWDEFEAAARYLQEAIDLREEDEPAFASNRSGISFDEAGTYRPAWIK